MEFTVHLRKIVMTFFYKCFHNWKAFAKPFKPIIFMNAFLIYDRNISLKYHVNRPASSDKPVSVQSIITIFGNMFPSQF